MYYYSSSHNKDRSVEGGMGVSPLVREDTSVTPALYSAVF